MKYNQIIKFFIVFLFIISLFMVSIPLTAQAKTTKILIMPFQINAENNYDFLKRGIEQMLQSRLNVPEKSLPLTPGTLGHDTADETLFGTITIFGNSINTTAKLMDTKTGKIILNFNKLGRARSEVLMHINLLAQQIKKDILHIKPQVREKPLPGKENEFTVSTSAFESANKQENQSSWSSRAFNKNFISLAIADINGDSKNETITATEKVVYIYMRNENNLKEISEFKAKPHTKILSVDAADINKNNKAEIYVTCIDKDTNKPVSFVLEWTGTKFTRILDNQVWLFRIIKTKTRGTMLLGQIPGSGDSMLDSQVSQLNWKENELVSKPLKLPKYVSLYSFTFGDVMNNGSEMLVVLTESGKIEIFNSAGKILWGSDKEFGGSNAYIEYKGEFYNGDSSFQMSRIFLQQRIFVSDFDHKGKNSVFVVRNHDIASSLLANTRFFIDSYIASMTWDKTDLVPDGRTQVFTGYISDYTIADQDNDGKKELVFSIPVLRAIIHQQYTTRLYALASLAVKADKKSPGAIPKRHKAKKAFKLHRMNPF